MHFQKKFFYRTLLLTCSLALVFSLSSCSNKGKLDKIGAPGWVFDPYSVSSGKGEVAAVGISDSSKGGIKMQIEEAQANARAEIANQILSEVSRITKDAMRKTSVDGIEDVQKIFSQATKEMVDKLPISGSRRTHIWQDPKTDSLYIRMALDGKKVSEHLSSSMELYERRIRQSGMASPSPINVEKLSSAFSSGVEEKFGSND